LCWMGLLQVFCGIRGSGIFRAREIYCGRPSCRGLVLVVKVSGGKFGGRWRSSDFRAKQKPPKSDCLSPNLQEVSVLNVVHHRKSHQSRLSTTLHGPKARSSSIQFNQVLHFCTCYASTLCRDGIPSRLSPSLPAHHDALAPFCPNKRGISSP
jgi:hypothetical protein